MKMKVFLQQPGSFFIQRMWQFCGSTPVPIQFSGKIYKQKPQLRLQLFLLTGPAVIQRSHEAAEPFRASKAILDLHRFFQFTQYAADISHFI